MKTTDFVKKAYSVAKDFALKMQKKNIDTCAGSTSFFIMLSIIRGFNSIYEVDEKRPVMLLRLIAVLYTLAMIGIVLLMLLLMVFGNVINSFLSRTWPTLSQGLEHMVDFKFVIIIGGATLLFSMIYTYIPSIKLSYIRQLPGALFSAVVWYIFSMIFAVHVDRTTRYKSLYGSLATPIVLMLWIYFGIYIFFIGAHINHYLLIRNDQQK